MCFIFKKNHKMFFLLWKRLKKKYVINMKWKIVNSNLSKHKKKHKAKKQYLQFTSIKVSSLKSIYMKQKTLYIPMYIFCSISSFLK